MNINFKKNVRTLVTLFTLVTAGCLFADKTAGQRLDQAIDKTKELAQDAKDKAKEKANEAKDKAKELAQDAKDKAKEAKDKAKKKIHEETK
ncbi:MAG TPA: hypothetical protein VLG76_07800 [Rhabdochlamydiaceae bacterium]|nr:hypothetical protein [Rhabdochlamydiaceae bacterium]